MSLHDRIMRIEPIGHLSSISRIHFVNARNRAALVAVDADELMAEMAEELKWYRADKDAEAVLQKYNAYKEQSK